MNYLAINKWTLAPLEMEKPMMPNGFRASMKKYYSDLDLWYAHIASLKADTSKHFPSTFKLEVGRVYSEYDFKWQYQQLGGDPTSGNGVWLGCTFAVYGYTAPAQRRKIAVPLQDVGEEAAKQDKIWIKVDDLVKEIDRKLITEEWFQVEFGGSYLLKIEYFVDRWVVSNAVDGWGNNCKEQFKDVDVMFLEQYPQPEASKDEQEMLWAEIAEEYKEELLFTYGREIFEHIKQHFTITRKNKP